MDLELITSKKREEYPEDGLEILAELQEDEFLQLKTKYSSKGRDLGSVGAIHESGELQSLEYARTEQKFQQTNFRQKVLVFVVTQVVNRCHVTQVDFVPPAAEPSPHLPADPSDIVV